MMIYGRLTGASYTRPRSIIRLGPVLSNFNLCAHYKNEVPDWNGQILQHKSKSMDQGSLICDGWLTRTIHKEIFRRGSYPLGCYYPVYFGNQRGYISRQLAREMNTFRKLNTSENIWTIPNYLCVARMAMAPILGYLVVNSQFPIAIGLLVVAGLTDLADGWIARVLPGQSSVLGSFLDPMADKILVGTLFLSLTYINLIPIPLTVLVLSRDIFLVGAGFYIRYQSLQPPRTISKYFDITSPSAQLKPTTISKINTSVQLSLIGVTLLSTVVPGIEHSHLVFIWYCTGGSTILSALGYVFAKDTYRIIGKTPIVGKKDEKDS